tara:strand:+ start:511 stop:708 length:198 start_codon:yes stop_codon:yes gene_type:complete
MTINQFTKKLAAIHNEYGLLYSDMLDQETLFKVQDSIIELLLEAHNDGALSNNTLMQFNHIFKIK